MLNHQIIIVLSSTVRIANIKERETGTWKSGKTQEYQMPMHKLAVASSCIEIVRKKKSKPHETHLHARHKGAARQGKAASCKRPRETGEASGISRRGRPRRLRRGFCYLASPSPPPPIHPPRPETRLRQGSAAQSPSQPRAFNAPCGTCAESSSAPMCMASPCNRVYISGAPGANGSTLRRSTPA
jgi:hypothetical protein